MSIRGWASLVCWTTVATLGCVPDNPPTPRAIVLITVDGLVRGDTAPFGGPLDSPGLQRLIDGSLVWHDAWTSSPHIRSAATTYLTGLAPDRHGVTSDHGIGLAGPTTTLATLMAEQGYRTAAFPDSSYLGPESGLLRGFEITDLPPTTLHGPNRWMPQLVRTAQQMDNLVRWLESLPADERYFVWLHTSRPLIAQIAVDAESAETSMRGFDTALTRLIEALEARGDWAHAVVALGGTLADVSGRSSGMPGVGFSLEEPAIQVPFVLRLPPAWTASADTERAAWAPDLAVTLAALAGSELNDADGRNLLDDAGDDRVLVSWAYGTREQAGWQSQRAARLRRWKRTAGLRPRTIPLQGGVGEPESSVAERLDLVLESRRLPSQREVALADSEAVLTSLGIELDPVPIEGRAFGDAASRREVADLLWKSRANLRRSGRARRSLTLLDQLLKIDPDNYSGLVDTGWMLLSRPSQTGELAKDRMFHAASLYPRRPDTLHAVAHAIWTEDHVQASEILEVALPFRPTDSDMLYDLACAASLSGDLAVAEERLRAAIEAGYKDFRHMESDADLRELRSSGRFADLMLDYRQ